MLGGAGAGRPRTGAAQARGGRLRGVCGTLHEAPDEAHRGRHVLGAHQLLEDDAIECEPDELRELGVDDPEAGELAGDGVPVRAVVQLGERLQFGATP